MLTIREGRGTDVAAIARRTITNAFGAGRRPVLLETDRCALKSTEICRPPSRTFCTRLKQILDRADFTYVETLFQRFYASEVGRPALPPSRDFRLLLIGYFEGLGPELVIAWRVAVAFALREFRGLVLPEYLGLERRLVIRP